MNRSGNRQSRAVWKNQDGGRQTNNPYATNNNNLTRTETNRSYVSMKEAAAGGGVPPRPPGGPSSNSLQVPNPYGNMNNANGLSKQNRRMSIHYAAHQHGRSFSQSGGAPPPLPVLPSGLNASGRGEDKPLSIEQKIFKELGHGSAAEVDDYYKTLKKQNQLITRDIKENINQNQKNILQLTKDLKETQEELVNMRVTAKDLFEVLDDFRDAAERRLKLEFDAPQQQQQQQQQQQHHPHSPTKQSQLRPSKNQKDRSSILVLEKMWAKEIQSLFKHVEGASKFIQPIPGRHVLAESGRWHEVNVGTWKPSHAGHLFILNDLILIATRKPSGSGAGGGTGGGTGGGGHPNLSDKSTTDAKGGSKLQAIQCLPLIQVSINQVKPPKSDNSLYFINIKTKSLSYVYSTDRYDHLVKIVDAFNKGKNEVVHAKRLENGSKNVDNDGNETKEEKRQLRETLRRSGSYNDGQGLVEDQGKRISGPGGMASPTRTSNSHKRSSSDFVLDDISARVHSRNRSQDMGQAMSMPGNGNAGQKSSLFNEIKRVEDKLDDVDVYTSQNEYVKAVESLNGIEARIRGIENKITKQKSQSGYDVGDEVLLLDVSKLKISNRKQDLTKNLLFDLQNNISRLSPTAVGDILHLFDALNQLQTGIQAYLNSTSLYLSTMVSRLIVGLQGSTKVDVVNYLSNLVVVNVAIVKRTVETYNTEIKAIVEQSPQNSNVDSSGLVDWCADEFGKLFKQIKKHLYGTLLIVESQMEEEDDGLGVVHVQYRVKDENLYEQFAKVLETQLDELKRVGVNVDFIFDSILNIKQTTSL
ncbi:EXO84 [Candida theae]|uniref:Exocyst complex component EXO84 n=1 Tax=Candida theae TaxID=1198502 RepID=A0AAD5BIG3_9ASCO|nr:EXO84 [Candida theae]KAI5964506.1 EXO84 [Candida theae]